MTRLLVSLACWLLFFFLPAPAANAATADSVGLLVAKHEGQMMEICTATAVAVAEKGTMFLTAAHCVSEGGKDRPGVSYFITMDERGEKKTYHKATVLLYGNEAHFNDYAVLLIKEKGIPVVELGSESELELGDAVYVTAGPMGMGKLFLPGIVASLYFDRAEGPPGCDWQGAIVTTIPIQGGASGAAVICAKTQHVVGIVLGMRDRAGNYSMVMPISKFKDLDPKELKYVR